MFVEGKSTSDENKYSIKRKRDHKLYKYDSVFSILEAYVLTLANVPLNVMSMGGLNKSSKVLFLKDEPGPCLIISSCCPITQATKHLI